MCGRSACALCACSFCVLCVCLDRSVHVRPWRLHLLYTLYIITALSCPRHDPWMYCTLLTYKVKYTPTPPRNINSQPPHPCLQCFTVSVFSFLLSFFSARIVVPIQKTFLRKKRKRHGKRRGYRMMKVYLYSTHSGDL